MIVTEAELLWHAHAADMDRDGDIDVLFREPYIGWYENTDGRGTFKPRQVTTEAFMASVSAVDLDGDGDIDIVVASASGNGNDRIVRYEQPQIVAGDANRNLQFDQSDIVQSSPAGKVHDAANCNLGRGRLEP